MLPGVATFHAIPETVVAMPEYFTPSQVARMLRCSTTKVRRLTTQFAEQLSAGAAPPPGQGRHYTPEDVAVLQAADSAASAGHSNEKILAMLETVTLPPAMPQNATLTRQDSPESPPAMLTLLEGIARQIDVVQALQTRLEASEDARRQAVTVSMLAMVVSVISLLLAFVVLVAVLLR